MYSAEKGPLFVLSLDFIVCRYISYIHLFKYIYTTTGKGKTFFMFSLSSLVYNSHFQMLFHKIQLFLIRFFSSSVCEVQQILIIGTFNLFFILVRDMNYKYLADFVHDISMWGGEVNFSLCIFSFRFVYSTKVCRRTK